jgi:competence protein ComEC
MMRAAILVLIAASIIPLRSVAQTTAPKTLDIYVIDVEGGNATLFVSPSGESMLIDTGNAGAMPAMRDVSSTRRKRLACGRSIT